MSILSTKGSASNLLDKLIFALNLANDAALSRALNYAPPVISKLRNSRIPIGDGFLIEAHEVSGFSIAELKEFAGMPPAKRWGDRK